MVNGTCRSPATVAAARTAHFGGGASRVWWCLLGVTVLTSLSAFDEMLGNRLQGVMRYGLPALLGGACGLLGEYWCRRWRKASTQIRETDEQLKLIQRYTSDGISLAELDPTTYARRLIWCNDRFVKTSGRSRQELMAATNLNDWVSHSDEPEDLQRWGAAFNAGIPFSGQASWIRPDGKENYFEWTVAPVTMGHEFYLIGVDRDITAQKDAEKRIGRLKDELTHATRIGIIGEVAAELAHELNQPLSSIANYAGGCAQRLRSETIGSEELGTMLARISEHAVHAGGIVYRVTELARRGPPQRTTLDINDLLEQVLVLVEFDQRRHNGTLKIELAPDLPPINADRIQIQQVILNLVHNACEAMLENEAKQRRIVIRTAHRGAMVSVSIADAGSGIDPEAAERLFEPFFTTKGKGMGLGLAISRSIIEAHGGRLMFEANDGGGTTFTFTLPTEGDNADDRE